MTKGIIRLQATPIKNWMKTAGVSQEEFSKRINEDSGNVSKYMSGVLEPSKSFIKKVMALTGFDFSVLLEYDRDAKLKKEKK